MKKSILLIFIIVTSVESHGATRILGNSHFSDKEVLRLVDAAQKDDSVLARITDLYRRAGYFNVMIRITDTTDSSDKIIDIAEGKPSRISDASIEIAPDSREIEFDKIKNEYVGRIASEKTLNEFAAKLVRYMAENGMPFARGGWTEFRFDENGDLVTTFMIVSGNKSIIAGLVFKGIKRTRSETVERVANLKTGNLYSESRIVESEKLVARMPYIEIESPFELEASVGGDSCWIIYNLRELPSTRLEGVGGYISTGKRSEFLGRLDMEFGDILGTGRSLGFFLNKKDRYSSELRINYLEPFILNSRFDLGLEAFQTDRDTVYIETGGRVGFIHRFSLEFSGSLWFSLKMTEPESDANISSSTSRSVRLEFDYDATDFRPNPRSGYEINTEVDYRYRSNRKVIVGDEPPTSINAVGFKGGYYLNPGGRFVIALGLAGWGIVAVDGITPADELRYIGGFSNLRGYADQQFPAYRYAIATMELRLVGGQQTRTYLFSNFGAIKTSQYKYDDYRFWPGYGFGLVSPTTLGLFKIEAGWGKSGFPSEAVLNFGLAGRF